MIKYFFIFLIVIIISSFLQQINGQVYNSPVLNPNNNHYYQIINETLDGLAAIEKCKSLPAQNGMKGYLATFTSDDEWTWVAKNLIKLNSWMSGTDLASLGKWTWNPESPESYQPMYNIYIDKCYTFCFFGGSEPNLINQEHWVHTSGSLGQTNWNNLFWNRTTVPNAICEYGGLEEPFVPASPTQGSTVIISNIVGFDYTKVKINFTPRETSTAFSCTPIKINSTHANCIIPPGQGRFTYIVTDGIKSSPFQMWQYELPYIGAVMPVFTSGSKLTITGGNFGSDSSKITITLSNPAVICNSIVLYQNNEAITCILAANATPLLPITITVSNSKFIAYKAAVYYDTNKLFYSGFATSASFTVSKNTYSEALRVEGQVGHIGVFDSQGLAEFIQKTTPKGIVMLFWQNVYYNPTTNNFRYLSGPKIDQVCNLYYKTPLSVDSSWTAATRFTINATDFALAASTASASTFTEYGGYDPTFTVPGKVHSISPEGGVANLAIDNYGTVFSVIKVIFQSVSVPFVRDFVAGELIATIPAGFDGPYDISVDVDGKLTPAGTQFVTYYAPLIENINRVPTTGGLVTISGKYFSNTLSNSVLVFGSLSCTGLTLTIEFSELQCIIPPSSGTHSVTLKVSSKTSTVYSYQYQSPNITMANNIPQSGGVVTIEGSNFGTAVNDIKVAIGSYQCVGISIINAHTKITCNAPIGTPNTYDLIVTVAGVPSTGFSMYYFSSDRSISQVGYNILISGTDLPSTSLLSISLGTIDISTYCLGSGSLITCSNLPLTLISGSLSMFKGLDVYPVLPFTLTPYISAISNSMLDTITSTTITLTGRYFESVTLGTTNTIVVQQDTITLDTSKYQYIDSQTIKVFINGGFGKGFKLSILIGTTRSSNQVEYSFFPPELKTIKQIGSIISITGTNFSSVSTDLTFGNYQPSLTTKNSNNIEFNLTSISRNGEIYVIVGQQKSNSLVLELTPSLNSQILPKPNIHTTTPIKITGEYLYQLDSNGNNVPLEFYAQLKTLSNTPAVKLSNCISSIENEFICDMITGYGLFDIFVISNSILKSNIIENLEYVSPIAGLSTSIYYQEPATVLINIENVNVDFTTIKIGGSSLCSDLVFINKTYVSCKFEADILYPQGKQSLNISVECATLTGFIDNGFKYTPLLNCPSINENECSGNGICNQKSGLCQCNTNWNFTDCSNDMTLIGCPNNCSSQGTCDRKTGLCSCNTGFEGLDCTDISCPNNCSSHGTCDKSNGKCLCNDDFQSIDCNIPLIPCLNNCNGVNGQCNNQTGICLCTSLFEGIDCSDKTCPNNCSLQGSCDKETGTCFCNDDSQGKDCSIPLIPCLNNCNGVNGQCNNQTGTCLCTSLFQGIDCSDKTCPNNCSDQGSCDKETGKCFCYTGKAGLDCSIDITNSPNIPPPYIDENGTTTFPGKNIKTTVSITHLREMDIADESIKVLRLKDIKWIERSNISKNQYYFKGVFENDPAIFELVIKYFQESTQLTFANQEITIPSNSIKYLVTISNWNFTSQFNSLQTIYLSKTNEKTIIKCEEHSTNSTVLGNDFQIDNGESLFNGKFANNVIIDDTIFLSSALHELDDQDELYNDITVTDSEYNLLTSIDSPSFKKSVVSDPLFSSIFMDIDESECSTTKKWKIPVIVVLSTVGGLACAGAAAFVIKSKKASSKEFRKSISMSTRS